MIIQFISNEDKLAAELIQSSIGGRLHKGYIDPSKLDDDIIIIGAQEANSLYAEFVRLGVLPEVTIDMPGTVFVRSYRGFGVYGVAGDKRTQTIAAAEYVFLHGLPSDDTIAGDIGGLTLYEIGFSGDIAKVAEKLAGISAYIVDHLPIGYSVDYVGLRGNVLEVLIRSAAGLQILEPITISISMIVVIAIVVVGLVFMVRILSFYAKDIFVGVAESIAKYRLMDECMAKYECEYADDINNLYPERKINWWLIGIAVAGLGIGTYYIVKTAMPVARKKYAEVKQIAKQ